MVMHSLEEIMVSNIDESSLYLFIYYYFLHSYTLHCFYLFQSHSHSSIHQYYQSEKIESFEFFLSTDFQCQMLAKYTTFLEE